MTTIIEAREARLATNSDMACRFRSMCRLAMLVWLGLVWMAGPGLACVGDDCLNVWATADGGGELRVRFDYDTPVPVFESFCTPDRSSCLFSAIDPGFQSPPSLTPPEGLFRVADGTVLSLRITAIDAGLSINVNGNKLSAAGASAQLGTAPSLHVHPSWQIVAPGSQAGNQWQVSFQVTTNSSNYSDSPIETLRVLAVSEPDPTPTPTPTVIPCAGDCDGNGQVSVDELVTGVAQAQGHEPANPCAAFDADGDGQIAMTELIAAVDMVPRYCPGFEPVSLAEIQATIFTPKCATQYCHDTLGRNGNLELTEATSYGQLVGVDPSTPSASAAGLLRVAPGVPDESFLLIKLVGPRGTQGSRMPLGTDPLTDEEIDLVRRWILQGAQP